MSSLWCRHTVLTWSPNTFLGDLTREWVADLQRFVHVGLPKLLFIALFAWGVIVLVNAITEKILAVAETRASIGSATTAQVRTLASVLRATGIGAVLFLALLQVMENVLNFDLAPLLASAGVAGIAIGLAAQTLVKDLLNGILILVEDQYTVGDVVVIAGISGTVESMTLRKTSVRGADGTLYVIPNSQITSVANQSRQFSVTTVNISVDFSADPDEVLPLLQKIALGVREDPAYKNIFLEDPKVLGVDSIKGSEITYPIQLRTLARQQFDAVREMQRRIRLALAQHNMLPGSPYRVTGHPVQNVVAGSSSGPATAASNPTAAKTTDVDPFAPQ